MSKYSWDSYKILSYFLSNIDSVFRPECDFKLKCICLRMSIREIPVVSLHYSIAICSFRCNRWSVRIQSDEMGHQHISEQRRRRFDRTSGQSDQRLRCSLKSLTVSNVALKQKWRFVKIVRMRRLIWVFELVWAIKCLFTKVQHNYLASWVLGSWKRPVNVTLTRDAKSERSKLTRTLQQQQPAKIR